MSPYTKLLILVSINFLFFGCASLFQRTNDANGIQHQSSNKEPGCGFGRELYDTLQTIVSSDLSTEEDSDFSDVEESPKQVTSAFTHMLLDLDEFCGVKSKLKVYSSKKGARKYTLTIYRNSASKTGKVRYKESFTITTNSARELLRKAKTLFPEEN